MADEDKTCGNCRFHALRNRWDDSGNCIMITAAAGERPASVTARVYPVTVGAHLETSVDFSCILWEQRRPQDGPT